jgi:hypothetical protein
MPLWAWLVLVIAVLLAVMAVWDRRTRARGARLNDLGAMGRGIRQPQAHPDAHRGQMQPRPPIDGASGF